MVRLQHGIRRMQLLHVRIVGVQIHGQRVLRGIGLMRLVGQFVVQSTLWDREGEKSPVRLGRISIFTLQGMLDNPEGGEYNLLPEAKEWQRVSI